MHELSLADAIVGICSEHARGGTVVSVDLRVGRLRQVVPDALTFAWQLVAEGTPAEGAELRIEEVPARVVCRGCATETEVEHFPLACGHCGGFDVSVVAGEEFDVESLEIETETAEVARR